MSVVVPHKTIKKFAESQSKESIIETVGNLDNIQVLQNQLLVATYIRPEKTKGGLWMPDSALEEDIYQGKVGLVLKMGPLAFDAEDYFAGLKAKVHDWVVYRVGDSWDLTVRGVHCRLVPDVNIRLIVDEPEDIF